MTVCSEARPGEIVRELVCGIPRGRVASYGVIARVAQALGLPVGGARTVSWVLASLKGDEGVPWHRVVGVGGVVLLPDRRGAQQTRRLKSEDVRFRNGVIEPGFLLDEESLLSTLTKWSRGSRNRAATVDPGFRPGHAGR